MKKKIDLFCVKSIQTLGRFGIYSYFCRCQSVTGDASANHPVL